MFGSPSKNSRLPNFYRDVARTEPEKTLVEAMLSSLGQTVEYLEGLLGTDREGWECGKLHHPLLTHTLSALIDEEAGGRLNVGTRPSR